MAAISADVSRDGFCLDVVKPLEEGAEVSGYVVHGHRQLNFHGTVAWVQPPNPMASYLSRVGIKFTRLSPGLRALLSVEEKRNAK